MTSPAASRPARPANKPARAPARLSLRRDPARLIFSGGLWASAWYLWSYVLTGWVLMAVALAVTVAGGLLAITLAGFPVLIAAAAVIRWCAGAERARLRIVDPGPPRARYREPAGPGLLARLRAMWGDPALWANIAYLFGLLVPLLALDFAVAGTWLVLLAGITLPAWYGDVKDTCIGYCPANGAKGGFMFGSFPNGPNGPGASGLAADTLPKALLVAGLSLVAFAAFSYAVVATARLHAAIARPLLGPRDDPLREAKEVLTRPGPLSQVSGAGAQIAGGPARGLPPAGPPGSGDRQDRTGP